MRNETRWIGWQINEDEYLKTGTINRLPHPQGCETELLDEEIEILETEKNIYGDYPYLIKETVHGYAPAYFVARKK